MPGLAKWGLAAGTAASGFALFDLFSTASQFEQFRVVLENIEGSSTAAEKALKWVKNFAQTTPYELADVMDAFVSLKAYGIDPMGGSLTAVGDAAAGMNKTIGEAVEAVADAMTGEYERLKGFGITAAVAGDKVTLTYVKAGKAISVVAKKGIEAEKAVEGIFNARFGGMMAKQSTTFVGLIRNLKDNWSNFLLMVADAGVFDLVKSKIGAVLAKVNEWAKNGKIQAWAKWLSDKLSEAFTWATDFIEKTDWNAVGAKIKDVANAIGLIATGLQNAYKWYQLFQDIDSGAMDRRVGTALSPYAGGGAQERWPSWATPERRGIGGRVNPGIVGKPVPGAPAARGPAAGSPAGRRRGPRSDRRLCAVPAGATARQAPPANRG